MYFGIPRNLFVKRATWSNDGRCTAMRSSIYTEIKITLWRTLWNIWKMCANFLHRKCKKGIDQSSNHPYFNSWYSKSSYETRFRRWNVKKYSKAEYWTQAGRLVRKRRLENNRHSEVWIDGVKITEEKVQREMRRYPSTSLETYAANCPCHSFRHSRTSTNDNVQTTIFHQGLSYELHHQKGTMSRTTRR